ncbi:MULTISPECIES: nicotinate-nucleotide adenylyltransferase [Exiguobacterium]|uniref:nicotinate-nucleotide adenylyltransferase n=1 Tax=Exiguobacterium TaxID=33986 RepID=UPI001BE5CF45|nr:MULTISPECIES: nicotinate-nucleotide adenylyltransferase [Exiguobacterium]MCT4775880.1 nicotinate-nucleotide adenylyltransferase [Exiguobacterium aquaticum]MCT4789791.1 nicotinate-nucleotide adenylyltransferase [Exiguobacterium mexicanum]
MSRIGLMGGTFDPPHLGHLLIAEQAREQLELDEVWFLPAAIPPHKAGFSPAKDRIEMTRRAIVDQPAFKLNLIEFERDEPSYTVETMRRLRDLYPNDTFFFLIGADSLVSLEKWYDYETLVTLVTFGAVARPGSRYRIPKQADVRTIDMPQLEISSTDIRERARRDKSIKYLVPLDVETYIKERDLYDV